MLKKILKGCLAITMAIGFAAPVMAKGMNFNGFGAIYHGPVNRGGDSTQYMSQNGGLLLFMEASGEKLSTGVTAKYVLQGKKTVDMDYLHVDYKATDALTVRIGENRSSTSKGFAMGAGLVRGGVDHYNLEYVLAEFHGIHAKYKISDTMVVDFGLLNTDPYGADFNTGKNGSGSHASIGAKFGAFGLKIAYLSGVTDDAMDPTDDTISGAGTMVSAKYSMGKKLAVAFDYQSKKVDETTNAVTALQLRANKVGPGDIIATVANDTKTVGDMDSVKTAYTDLVYSIDVARGEKIQVVYLSKKVGDADATVFTQLGFIKFF